MNGWHFSRALVAEYSAASCSGGEPFALLNGHPLRHCCSVPAPERRNSSPVPRSGMTFALSTATVAPEWLTWFLAASRARTSALPVRGRTRWRTLRPLAGNSSVIGGVDPLRPRGNSPMLTLRGLGTVLGDLAEMGFDAEWECWGAHSIGAKP